MSSSAVARDAVIHDGSAPPPPDMEAGFVGDVEQGQHQTAKQQQTGIDQRGEHAV
jgi:hypothetical protein